MAWLLRRSRSTGLHDVTALIDAPVAAGTLMIERVGDVTYLEADGLRLGDVSGRIDLLPPGSLPAGMRPLGRSRWHNILTNDGSLRRTAFSPAGWVPMYFTAANDLLHFTVGTPTPGEFPSTAPGVLL